MIRLEPGDMLEVIPRLVAEGVVCDACVTDAPYHLTSIIKRFAKTDAERESFAATNPHRGFKNLSAGFMGQQWDGGDIAFRPETWATVASVMRPGAFLIAFGGTRTYHRLVTAIEDAGFIIQDQVAWLFGSGFPKRRDMLKPAFEPICLAYKPGGKRTLQADECRVGFTSQAEREAIKRPDSKDSWAEWCVENGGQKFHHKLGKLRDGAKGHDAGRWPANVCHDGSEEVIGAFPETHAAGTCSEHPFSGLIARSIPNDTGSAARFFYCAKADKQDRWGSRHPTVKPVELMKWLVPLVTPAGGLVLDPFAGSGTTGVAALATGRDCILIEREAAYIDDIRQRLAFYEGGGAHSVQAKNRSRQTDSGPLFA